jgi:hypothetical protein
MEVVIVVVVVAELAVRISLVLVLPEVQPSAKMVLVQMRVWPPQQHTPLMSLHGVRRDTSCTPRNRKGKEREKEKGAVLSVSLRYRERAAPYLLFPTLWTDCAFMLQLQGLYKVISKLLLEAACSLPAHAC